MARLYILTFKYLLSGFIVKHKKIMYYVNQVEGGKKKNKLFSYNYSHLFPQKRKFNIKVKIPMGDRNLQFHHPCPSPF